MKKFTNYMNEGAVNAPKEGTIIVHRENAAIQSYNNIYESQRVDEFLAILGGVALLWAFCDLVNDNGKGVTALFGGITAAAAGMGAAIKDRKKRKAEEKEEAKRAETEAKKKAEEEKMAETEAKKKAEEGEKRENDKLVQDRLNRMFICAQRQLEKETDKDSDDYKEAQKFVESYADAKFDDDGKPIEDPQVVNERLKKIVGRKTYAKFEENGKKAQKNEEVQKMLKGLAKEAQALPEAEVKEEETKQQQTVVDNRMTKATAEVGNIESDYDKKIEEAKAKGDDALVKTLEDEKSTKLAEAKKTLERAQNTQTRIQKQGELDAQKGVLKQQQDELATAQNELAELQKQKAKAIDDAHGDEKSISDINTQYDQQIKDKETKIKEKKDKVDEITKKVTKLETEAGIIKPVTTVAKKPAKSPEQQQAEKNLDDIKKEKEQKLIEAGDDEEKKKQIEDEYKEKIETAEKEVEKANSEALVKAGEESTGEESTGEESTGEESTGEGDEDDEGEATGDDSTEKIEYEEKDGKKTPINPATIWHRRPKEKGKGTTKNFYNKDGVSISEEEFKKRLDKYRELKGEGGEEPKKEGEPKEGEPKKEGGEEPKESLSNLSKFQKFILEKNRKSESNTLSNYLMNQNIR